MGRRRRLLLYILILFIESTISERVLKLSTSHEEIKEEGKSVVDSTTGPVDEVDAEASGNSRLPQASQECDEVNGWMSSTLIST
ncbi:hypothetical protein GOODEAATRI_032478, partial [Goodea atripinnis]